MNFGDILNKINGKLLSGNLNEEFIGKFKTNSLDIKEGDCFIAINGGHLFIDSAIFNGAKLIICNEDFYSDQLTVIKVTDTKEILLELASLIRDKHLNIPVIAVTGSVGKTTTKELIYKVLSSKYKVLKNEGNKNNRIGLSETLFKLSNDYNICILEMGMNHLGEINDLSLCAKPNFGIITNIGTSHIGYLKSKKNIFKAKREMLNGMNDGILFINGDDKYLKKIKYEKVIKVGLDSNNDLTAYNIVTTKEHLYFTINYNNRRYNVRFNIPNESLLTNILIAISVGLEFNVPIKTIIKQISLYEPSSHRNDILKLRNNTIIIDDCYNASFESIVSGLSMLKNYNQDKIIIIGDVLELGKYSKKIHKKIGNILNKQEGLIILVGSAVKIAYHKNFVMKNNFNEVIEYLKDINLNDKVIYLKGSRKMKLEEVKKNLLNRCLD